MYVFAARMFMAVLGLSLSCGAGYYTWHGLSQGSFTGKRGAIRKGEPEYATHLIVNGVVLFGGLAIAAAGLTLPADKLLGTKPG